MAPVQGWGDKEIMAAAAALQSEQGSDRQRAQVAISANREAVLAVCFAALERDSERIRRRTWRTRLAWVPVLVALGCAVTAGSAGWMLVGVLGLWLLVEGFGLCLSRGAETWSQVQKACASLLDCCGAEHAWSGAIEHLGSTCRNVRVLAEVVIARGLAGPGCPRLSALDSGQRRAIYARLAAADCGDPLRAHVVRHLTDEPDTSALPHIERLLARRGPMSRGGEARDAEAACLNALRAKLREDTEADELVRSSKPGVEPGTLLRSAGPSSQATPNEQLLRPGRLDESTD